MADLIVIAVLVLLGYLAFRQLHTKGSCSCGHGSGCSACSKGSCGNCADKK